jgi:alkylation response protein AidB-like acyl-CoA dehydrogenase
MPFEPGKIPEGAKPFKKGQTGNPNGRPKLPDLKAAMARILAEEKDGMTALDAILAALRAKAAKGDVRAAQELLDRGFGRAKQSIDHTTDGDKITGFQVTIKRNDTRD